MIEFILERSRLTKTHHKVDTEYIYLTYIHNVSKIIIFYDAKNRIFKSKKYLFKNLLNSTC